MAVVTLTAAEVATVADSSRPAMDRWHPEAKGEGHCFYTAVCAGTHNRSSVCSGLLHCS